jgi:hypothetical protein
MRPLIIPQLAPLLIALVWLMSAASAAAQTVRGRVVDRTTGAPVVGASVLLLDQAGQTRKMTITDATGAYNIEAPNPGGYTFRVDAAGYDTHNEPQFAVLAGRILELEIRLWGLTELEPVAVVAESLPFAPGPLGGFYERMDRGRGQYITRRQIEEMGVFRFTDILRMTPTVDVVARGGTQSTIRIKGTGRLGRDCPPLLYVDDVRWGTVDLDGDGPDRELYPSEVEAIEVYRPSAVPIEFSGFDTSCGVVVVWTKRAP